MSKKVFFVMAIAVALFSSCSSRNAQKVARNFLQYYYVDHNFDAAAALSSPATHSNLNMAISMYHFNPYSEESRFRNFEITDIDVRKTKAVFHYSVDGTPRRLLLSKFDGKWLVDMPEQEVSFDRRFSLSLVRSRGGGFTSAQSAPIRLGDTPRDTLID